MPTTQPRERIKYAGREVARYQEDVESATDRSTLEDMIAKANFLFGRIMHLDIQVNQYILLQRGRDDSSLQDEMRSLLDRWMAVSLQVVPEGEFGPVDGLDRLLENLAQARSILTPDDEFFDSDALSSLRDEAIDAHRQALTEPLSGNERQ